MRELCSVILYIKISFLVYRFDFTVTLFKKKAYPIFNTYFKGIVQPFELGGVTSLI
jgi:hypothetical protein